MEMNTLTEALIEGYKDIVTQCVEVATSVIPIGMGLLGLSKVFSVAKSFFSKSIGGSDSGDMSEAEFRAWAAENDCDIYADYDYDIDEE